jgi:threonine synthase
VHALKKLQILKELYKKKLYLKIKKNLYLQELSNGPTLAFKDLALQFLGNLFEYFLQKENRKLNILGATSGDTGSAAEYAVKGKENINIFMLSPKGKMSEFQRAQMFSLQDKNVFNIALDGVFDDAQNIVKNISEDLDFKYKNNIGAVGTTKFIFSEEFLVARK